MICEDCGAYFGEQLTPDEIAAIAAGINVCQDCLDSMKDEADTYVEIMAEEGYRCAGFNPQTGGFSAVPIKPGLPIISVGPATNSERKGWGGE